MDAATALFFTRYRAWADKRTYDAVAALPAGEAVKERPSLFKSIIGTLNHIYLIDRVWQAHVEGREHGFHARNLMLHEHLDELWRAQQTMHHWWIDWSAKQSTASFDTPMRFSFIDGGDGVMTRGAILLHVVNHASYHRGFIAEMFFAVPAKNPSTDLPVFTRELANAQ